MKTFTSKKLAKMISKGLPAYQRAANLEYIQRMNMMLSDGGMWIAPAANKTFIKRGKEWSKG